MRTDLADTPKPADDVPPPLSAADLRASGLNLLLLTAQAYYKMLESVLRSPCQALDLDLNQHYLWTVSTIENLLKNNPELRDFPDKFEPLVPDLYPSTVLDYDWQDFAAPQVEGFLAAVQKYVFGKGGAADLVQGSPAWIFVEMFRPNIIESIEKADAYNGRMQQHLQRRLKRTTQPPSPPTSEADPAEKKPVRQPEPMSQTPARPTMPFNTTAFRVMIASPSDVPEERVIVREVLNDWNDQHSEQRSVVLLPVGWETHSVPTLGDRPQAIINKQVLKNADALVGVFWTRIGTHTGMDVSGTVEEIREHVTLGKPAMLYFSSRPASLDRLDLDQFKQVQAFKTECRSWGLIETYKDHDEFRKKLARHINRLVSSLLDGKPVPPPTSAPEPELSVDSKTLLAEAVQDHDGCVLYSPTHDGADLDTNGKSLIPPGNPRKRATMLAALKQLQELEYLEDESGNGAVFVVTAAGFAAADKLGFKRADPPEELE